MRFLSNLFSRTGTTPSVPQISPANPEQITEAVEHLLVGPHQRPHLAEVHAFMASLKARGVDITRTRVITRAGKITYAVLPSILPGRTLMLISGMPADLPSRSDAAILVRQVTDEYASQDLSMMQVLLDPQDQLTPLIYAECGFRRVAELLYLECPTRATAHVFPPGLALEHYSSANHADFAAAILASYEETLDCPALNGVRSVEDVIAGHRSAGEYNPQNWLLLRQSGMPVGVLVLARVPGTQAMELVYIGLAAAVRGQGLARQLMQFAIDRAHDAGCRTLTTAVDAQNTPAMKMYLRAGMQRIGSRIAMVRVIHHATGDSSTIHPQSSK